MAAVAQSESNLYIKLDGPLLPPFKFMTYNVDQAMREERVENTRWVSNFLRKLMRLVQLYSCISRTPHGFFLQKQVKTSGSRACPHRIQTARHRVPPGDALVAQHSAREPVARQFLPVSI